MGGESLPPTIDGRVRGADQTARPEVYRANLAYAESMYCDSLMVSNGMAIAVLSDKPSDGRFDIPEEPDPLWKERDNFCERCNEARTEGWCEACRGRHCPECERCACSPLASNPTCQAAASRRLVAQAPLLLHV